MDYEGSWGGSGGRGEGGAGRGARLDELALQQPLEALDQLERGEDRRAVVEALVEHRAQPALELLDLAAEVVEVVVELLHLDVEHVVRHLGEGGEHVGEVVVDLVHRRRERAPLVAADLDLPQLLELDDRLHEVQEVVAALEEGV